MFHSLRARLALSHTLPILLFVPLLGLTLLYQLERSYFLDSLAKELAVQGALIASFTRSDPQLWRDPTVATTVLNTLRERIPANMEFVDNQAVRLAASGTEQQAQIGQITDDPLLREALQGQVVWSIDRAVASDENVIDVVVPVINAQGNIEGVVRLSHTLSDVQARIVSLRWLVLITLFAGAVVALVVGLALARSLGAPLLQLAAIVARFSPDKAPETVPETGPHEIEMLAANLNRLQHRLYELERTRKYLLSGIVHELARPLGSIKLAAQTIHNNGDISLAQSLAAGIDERVDILQLQLDDLALLGELELQGVRLQPEAVDVTPFLTTQCDQVNDLAADKHLTIDCQSDPQLPRLQADPRRLAQIIGNLLHNAIKYTSPGGQIVVRAMVEQSQTLRSLLITVTDTGPGIDPAEQERIFQFFYRNSTQRRIHQGMGIGLALSRQLAEAHGGTLTVQSRVGQGTTFCLRMPLA